MVKLADMCCAGVSQSALKQDMFKAGLECLGTIAALVNVQPAVQSIINTMEDRYTSLPLASACFAELSCNNALMSQITPTGVTVGRGLGC
jgi:hypothetical protein